MVNSLEYTMGGVLWIFYIRKYIAVELNWLLGWTLVTPDTLSFHLCLLHHQTIWDGRLAFILPIIKRNQHQSIYDQIKGTIKLIYTWVICIGILFVRFSVFSKALCWSFCPEQPCNQAVIWNSSSLHWDNIAFIQLVYTQYNIKLWQDAASKSAIIWFCQT